MLRSSWTIVAIVLGIVINEAAHAGGIELQKLKVDDGEIQYLLQLPTATGGRKQPGLLIAIPCADGSRRAADQDMRVYWAQEGAARGFVVACPLVRNGKLHAQDGKTDIKPLVEHLKKSYNIDPKRIVVGGASNGGAGSFEAAYTNPDIFAAALLIPGYNPDQARPLDKVAKTKFYIRAGQRDQAWASQGKILSEAMKKQGIEADFAELPNQGHMMQIPPKELFDWIDKALKG